VQARERHNEIDLMNDTAEVAIGVRLQREWCKMPLPSQGIKSRRVLRTQNQDRKVDILKGAKFENYDRMHGDTQ
jgi:hypothetical protein